MDKSASVLKLLLEEYPQAHCELEFSNNFELLIAVILSAQCTDKRVNIVTRKLFEQLKTPLDFVMCSDSELEKMIYSCGFYRNKAKNIKKACADIIERFNSDVPQTIEQLETLSGVGKKTASVVFAVGFDGQAIAVDTHVFRVSKRLGLAHGKTAQKVQSELTELLPQDQLSDAHHSFLFHGRYTCHSRKPECSRCVVQKYCDFFKEGI